MTAAPNPWDPWTRTDLSANERTLLVFMRDCMHGDDLSLIDRMVAEDYIQHTPGIGQGREGLRRYILEVAHRRPGRRDWRPVQIFAAGGMVILHKLIAGHVIADFVRFDAEGRMAEHWDVVQALPEPGYDPMRRSTEDFARFRRLFGLPGPEGAEDLAARRQAGLDLRHAMFGREATEAHIAGASPFMQPVQDIVTEICFGGIWTRPGLDLRTRSLVTLAMLAATGRTAEIRIHTRGALANGARPEELRELALHVFPYCGIPAMVNAMIAIEAAVAEVAAGTGMRSLEEEHRD